MSVEHDLSIENNLLWQILSNCVPVVIVVIGTIGNILSFLVFLKLGSINFGRKNCNADTVPKQCKTKRQMTKHCKSLSSENIFKVNKDTYTVYIFLSLLSLFDMGVLYFGLLSDWLETYFKAFNLKLYSPFFCKFVPFLAFILSDSSSWLVVVVAFIRLLAIYKPFVACQLTRKENVIKVVLGLFAVFAILNLYALWVYELKLVRYADFLPMQYLKQNKSEYLSFESYYDKEASIKTEEETYRCEITNNMFTVSVLPVFDKFVYCLFPFFILSIMNLLIIKKANLTPSKKNRFLYIAKFGSKNELDEEKRICSLKANKTHREYHLIGRKFTVMLLAKSFGFLILTLPIVIMFVMLGHIENYIENTADLGKMTKLYEQLNIVQKATYLLMYMNHSMNFFIYFKFSSRFRRILYQNILHRK